MRHWINWRLGLGAYAQYGPRNYEMRPPVPRPVPKGWWEELQREAARIREGRKPNPDDPRITFWHRMGVWITNINDFPVNYLDEYCKGEYSLVVVPCAWGQRMERDNVAELHAWTAAAQRRGYTVVGSQWGSPDGPGDCEREAAYAVAMARRFNFDGWIMNGEKRYEVSGWSRYYVRRFRADLPNMPLGWSPEVQLSLDHGYMKEQAVCYMPQAYPLEIPRATLDLAVQVGKNFGYELTDMLPLIQAYPTGGERMPAVRYRDDARRLGLRGLVLYTGNQSLDVPQYWRDLVL